MAEETREQRIAANTEIIARIYDRAIARTQKEIRDAIDMAMTYTMPSEIVETQQAYITRLKKLEASLIEGAKNPLGDFNWDWV